MDAPGLVETDAGSIERRYGPHVGIPEPHSVLQQDIPIAGPPTTEATLLRELAAGLPLREILAHLVHAIETRAPGMIASVLLVENGRLMYGAAPNLPDGYNQAANNHP